MVPSSLIGQTLSSPLVQFSGSTSLELVQSLANLRIAGQVITQAKALPPGTRIRKVEIDWENARIRLVP
jgi:hypothetical protein